jgi:hypothetical protein
MRGRTEGWYQLVERCLPQPRIYLNKGRSVFVHRPSVLQLRPGLGLLPF